MELAAVLTLLAVGASALAPTARRLGDRAAVVAAREEIIGALMHARATAVSSGGSSLTLIARPASVRIDVDGRVGRDTDVGSGLGVVVELGAGRDSTTFRFDRLGIGRFANGTVAIHRGAARASIVISSYGRVRRR